MRKILAFLASLAFCFGSCSSNDDSSSENLENYVIGVWQETFYWDRTDWHTWGLVSPPVWHFNADKTYQYYDCIADYENKIVSNSGTWTISDKYLSTDIHARAYSFSDDKKTLTWERVAIMKKR